MRSDVVTGLSQDRGVQAYSKWGGAFWRLISLVDLGVPEGHPGAVAAAETALRWASSPRRLAEIHRRRIDGRVRRCASQEGQVLRCCLAIGLRGDPRLDTLAESLVDTQWPDGGWNCDRKPHVTHSSFNETWGPILGLAAYGAPDAVERGAEFLLVHRVIHSHRTGELAHHQLPALRFPAYWHYGLLPGLRTVHACGRLDDPRAADALDLLASKRQPDGAWRVDGKWWKAPGSKGSNVEVVDWGEVANEVLTEQALDVLGAAGRL
ncbi:MAG TPA: hypothetical protein VFT35_07335 [Gaiellaceae bacterium]|nr:hypothetical protein [Gaiellaceae bacterium]